MAPDVRSSTVFLFGLFVIAVWAEYCAYSHLTLGGIRFLLPAFGFMMVGLAVARRSCWRPTADCREGSGWPREGSRHCARRSPARPTRRAVRAPARPSSSNSVWRKIPHNRGVGRRKNSTQCGDFQPPAQRFSAGIYAGRMTLAYVSLDPAWLDRAISWLGTRRSSLRAS